MSVFTKANGIQAFPCIMTNKLIHDLAFAIHLFAIYSKTPVIVAKIPAGKTISADFLKSLREPFRNTTFSAKKRARVLLLDALAPSSNTRGLKDPSRKD